MQEEVKTQKGKNAARADIAIWKSPKDKQDKNPPLIIVECKADTIRISENDYAQGESYARLTNAPFFVTHNSYETRFWRVIKDKMPGFTQEIANIPENNASDKEIDKLLKDLVVFKEAHIITQSIKAIANAFFNLTQTLLLTIKAPSKSRIDSTESACPTLITWCLTSARI